MTTQKKPWMNLIDMSSYMSLSPSFIRRLVSEEAIQYTRSSTDKSKLLFKSEWGDAYLERQSSLNRKDEL